MLKGLAALYPRRKVLAGLVGLGITGRLVTNGKAADFDDVVFHSNAIAVKNPAGVLLEAITRVGSRLVAVGEHGVIITSDDAGKTWLQAQVGVDVTLTCVAFATPLIGWAGGHFGVVLNTVNGGRNWSLQLTGPQENELALTAATHPDDALASSPAAAFGLKRATIMLNAGPSKPFLALNALNQNEVLAFGAYRMTALTRDGGKTWADWSLHIADRLSHNLYATAQNNGKLYVAGESGNVFCSSDGGNEFLALPSPSDVTILGIVSSKSGNLITFGVAGSAFVSQDQGTTWSTLNLVTQDNLCSGTVLNSGTIIVASEGGAIFHSSDEGLTFTQINGLGPNSIFDLVEMTDSNIAFVGAEGVGILERQTLNI